MCRFFILLCLFAPAAANQGSSSPVQKVIELLDDCKGKIVTDLAAEEKEVTDYTTFCDEESETKGYAIKTATSKIADLMAAIEDSKATIMTKDDEIVGLGSDLAKLDAELATATADRESAKTTFGSTEKELVTTVDQMGRAILEIKKSMSFLQTSKSAKGHVTKKLRMIAEALSKIADAAWVTEGNKRVLNQFMQSTQKMGEDDDLTLKQPQAKMVAYESHSGGIVETIEDMKGKAEEALSDARRAETKAQHSYKMMAQSLNSQIKTSMEKKSAATSVKSAAQEGLAKAEGELAETQKAKAADEAYVATLKAECEKSATEWAARQEQAKGELGAISKAKEILLGVKVFVQFSSTKKSGGFNIDVDDDDKASAKRASIVNKLKEVAQKSHSFALMEMATAAGSDPFVKIRGLIEDMIAKLMAEAQAEATQKSFCDEEISKSKASQAEKTATFDKLQSRLDQATSTKAELEEEIKELEKEVAEIDASQAEATKMRSAEHETYLKSSKDFKDSAEATERAIVVLKEYYEGGASLIQVNHNSQQPTFGVAKSDAGSSIISILEMCAEDFTATYTEIETEEMEKAKSYAKQSDENKLAKATKLTSAKAKASEVKSLTVAIENTSTDKDMTSKELDAVFSYLDKLKPQCETKVMSYAEKKAKREAEIEGLKEALEILDGSAVLLQIKAH